MSQLEAVLWDLDGTMIDSEPYWMATELEITSAYEANWTREDALASIGNPIEITCQAMIDSGVDMTVPELTDALFNRMNDHIKGKGLPYRAGVRALMDELFVAGIPQALVTMSFGSYVDSVEDAFPPGYISVIRTGDTIERGKPDPQIFHAAAADLGVPINATVALEDSPAGVGAILASGATPIGVRNTIPLVDDARLIALDTLEGVNLRRLKTWHREWQEKWGNLA